MNKKLVATLILVLVVNLLAAPMVMAEETDKNTEQKEEEVKQEEETDEEEIHTLDELVVIASKHPEKLSEAPVSVEKIDEEDIEKKNAHDVADLLRGVAGVNIRDNGGVGNQKTISIRGSGAEQVLVLIDGQPMNSRQNGQINLSQLPTDQIEKIEILKGPASSLYGANALGGVVNITTKSGSQKPITNLDINFGSFKTREFNLTHKGNKEKLKYNLSVLKKKSDGHRKNSELDQNKIFTKFDYQLDSTSNLILSLQHNNFDKNSPGNTYDPTPNAEQKDEDMNLNLTWKKQIDSKDQKLNVFYNQHDSYYDDPDEMGYDGPSDHDTERAGMIFDQTNYYQEHNLTYGLEAKYNKIDSSENGKHDYLNKALFIQDEWKIIKPLKVNLGGRYDYHEKFGSEFSPRIGIVYTINSKLNVYASVAEAYRTPTFNDLYWPETSWEKGNLDLKPEFAEAYETGIRYSNNSLKTELNLFKKDVENLIDWAPDENDGKYTPSNINSAEITGVEVVLSKKLLDNLFTNFNYTYLDTRDKETEEKLTYRPYHASNINLTYDLQDINISLNGKFIGERNYETYYSKGELPSHFVIDLKINKTLTKKTKISFELNNLLDREYEIIKDYPMPGRNFMLNLSREF